jgi:hypothetical protein
LVVREADSFAALRNDSQKGKSNDKDVPGAKAPVRGDPLLSGLKPGPISEASTRARAKAKEEADAERE